MQSHLKNKIICGLCYLFVFFQIHAQEIGLDTGHIKHVDTQNRITGVRPLSQALVKNTVPDRNDDKSLDAISYLTKQKFPRPFYLSPLFIIVVSFIIVSFSILFLYSSYRVHLQRILLSQKIRDKIAADLHDDVGSSLSSISLYSEIAKQQVRVNNPDAVPYFEKIGDDARQIIEEMNDIVWAINPKNDSMEIIVKRMEAFACNMIKAKNIALNFQCHESTSQVKLPMDKRRNFYLIFKEAINNSVKYAECKNLSVVLFQHQGIMKLTITDDGKGFDITQTYMGNGLFNLKKRTQEMNGTIEINSTRGKGTVVNLQFKTT